MYPVHVSTVDVPKVSIDIFDGLRTKVVASPLAAITWTLWISGHGQSDCDVAPQRMSALRQNGHHRFRPKAAIHLDQNRCSAAVPQGTFNWGYSPCRFLRQFMTANAFIKHLHLTCLLRWLTASPTNSWPLSLPLRLFSFQMVWLQYLNVIQRHVNSADKLV